MVTTATVLRPRAWRGLQAIPDGMDPEAPAMLYLVAHRATASLRIGDTSAPASELDDLESLGWRVVRTWWFDLGFDALEVEERLLDRWRNLFSLRPRLDPNDPAAGDATTTITASHATEVDAIRFVDELGRELAPAGSGEPIEPITDDADDLAAVRHWLDPWLLAS